METRPWWATPRNPARATIAHEVVNIMGLLGWAAMPWLQEILETAFEIDPTTGLLWYPEIVIIVSRQSGKRSIALSRGVHRMIMWPDRQYLLYIAQTREKALEKLQEERPRLFDIEEVERGDQGCDGMPYLRHRRVRCKAPRPRRSFSGRRWRGQM